MPTDTGDATGSDLRRRRSFSVTKAQSTTSVSVQVGKVKAQGGPQEFVVDMTATVQLETGRTRSGTVTFTVDGVEVATATVSGGSARVGGDGLQGHPRRDRDVHADRYRQLRRVGQRPR